MSDSTTLVANGRSLRELGWRVIDIHAHLGRYGAFEIPYGDADGMVANMDRLGIATACISSLTAINADYVRGNDLTAAAVRRHPGRFVGYAVANPWEPSQITAELTRAFDELGLSVIKVHPTLWGLPVTEARYEPIWAFAQQRNTMILSHTWAGDRTCRPSLFREIAARHPNVAFVLGHSGGPPEGNAEAIEVASACPNVYLEVCYSQLTRPQLEGLVQAIGHDRILLGTDTPFIDPSFTVAKVAASSLAVEQRQAILGENAARLLQRHAPQAGIRA